MNSVSRSAVPYRLTRVALWALAIACAVAWLAAVVTELQVVPQPRAQPSPYASGPTGQAAARPAQANGTSPSYWAEVGRAAGSN
jgi:hypothetical protein